MAWSSALHPRAPAGASAGGQFTAGSASSSKQASAKTKPKPKTAKLTAAKKTRSSKGGRRTVTVRRGDTLSGIARKAGESLAQLKKDNPGLFSKSHRGGNLIFPGNKVKLAGRKKAAKAKRAKLTKRPTTKKAVLKKAPKPKAAPKTRSSTTKRAAAPKAAPKRTATARPRMARSTTGGTRRSSARVVSRGGGVTIARKKR
jgi:LysM repeat protein